MPGPRSPPASRLPAGTPCKKPTSTALRGTQPSGVTPLPAGHLRAGGLARFNGDWERAIEEYRLAVESSADREEFLQGRLGEAQVLIDARRYPQALEVLDDILLDTRDEPQRAQAFYLRGRARQALED